MKKEEILDLNKQDNQRFDEREQENIIVACNKAYRIGRFLCALIISFDAIIAKRISFATWSVFLIMTATYLFYKYKCSKKKYEIVLSVIYATLGILFFIKYFISLVG